MGKKKRCCASCGGDDRVHRDILHGIPLCIHCEALDTCYGYPVLKNEPEECPFCRGWMETGLMMEDDLIDEDLLPYFEEDDPCTHFIYDCAQCENWECSSGRDYIAYGRRWYWNPKTEDYDADKPLVGPASYREYNQAQEAAGQKLLPGLD